MDYVTIASAGDAADFGDLTAARQGASRGPSCSNTRGLFGSGDSSNVIDYITIASTGDAADFGDTLSSRASAISQSDSHGGLQG